MQTARVRLANKGTFSTAEGSAKPCLNYAEAKK